LNRMGHLLNRLVHKLNTTGLEMVLTIHRKTPFSKDTLFKEDHLSHCGVSPIAEHSSI